MLIPSKFKLSVPAVIVIASTSSVFAIDLAHEQQLEQAGQNKSQRYTAYPGVRTRFCPLVKWKDNRTVASVVACGLDQQPF